MSYREDIHKNLKETFGYDELDRLNKIAYYVNGNHQVYLDRHIMYDESGIGNTSSITGVGSEFTYGGNDAGPHALTSVSRPEPGWRPGPQEIEYTTFNKVSSVVDTVEGGSTISYEVFYGLDNQRRKSIFKDSGQVIQTKHYFGDYERINENSSIKNYHYVSSPTGLCAIFVTEGSGTQGQLWHTYTDHLGSLVYMVNIDNSNDYKEYSFDAWGNPRDAADWTDTLSEPLFGGRGFTGHEHLKEFALIDMNGRIYDPMLGRFFSPDPFVQLPGYAGSYDRYSYCLNNPLTYTDPDGEFFWAALPLMVKIGIGIGAGIGAYTGYKIGEANGASGLGMVGYVLGGAAIGGFSGYLGGTIAAGGGLIANTAGIIYSSAFNSMGMCALSGGRMQPNISFGFGSFDFSTGEFRTIFNWGDLSTGEKLGYSFGALANIQDIVAGFNGTTIDVKSRPKLFGHSQFSGKYKEVVNGNSVEHDILVSVGPDIVNNLTKNGSQVNMSRNLSVIKWEMEYVKLTLKGNSALGRNVSFIRSNHPQIVTKLNNVNGKLLSNMTNRLNSGRNLLNIGALKYGLFNGCVNHTSRALLYSGVVNVNAILPITAPVLLNAELFIRQMGMYASPYLINY